jgi:hypothetical protein
MDRSFSRVVSNDQHTTAAKADFFGRDLEWTRNCPGGGHGRVRLSGDYVHEGPRQLVYIFGAVVFSLGALLAAFALVPRRHSRPKSLRNR